MDLVDEYLKIESEIAELEKRKAELSKTLLENANAGDVLEGSTGKLRVQQNNNLNSELLKAAIPNTQWTQITERKPVAALVTAAVKRGKISPEVINAAKIPGKTYLKKA